MDSKARTDLKALLKILRAEGVMRFDDGTLKIELHPDAMKVKEEPTGEDIAAAPKDKWSDFPTGTLSAEELAYWSAGGPAAEEDNNS